MNALLYYIAREMLFLSAVQNYCFSDNYYFSNKISY